MDEIKPGYIRVTDVLDVYFNREKIPEETLINAKNRGTHIHYWIECYLDGVIVPVPEEWAGYTESFKTWKNEVIGEFSHVKRLYNDEFMLTGMIDNLVKGNEQQIIVDYKTSSAPSKSWPLQAGAYWYLMEAEYNTIIDGVTMVHLKKDGSAPKLKYYSRTELVQYWDIFLGAYKTYKHFYG